MSQQGEDRIDAAERRAATDRRRARREAQAQLRSIVQHLADGIVIVGMDGTIRFANPAAEQLFGRAAKELLGTPFGHPLANGEPAPIDILRPGGATVAAELRVVDISWDGQPARLVSLRDITERRKAEERARQLDRERAARAEAEAANHAKSELLANMSHELRTPLNAVLGYAELLDLGVGGTLPPKQRHQVERIRASGKHLLGLVDEILDLAKVDAGRLALECGTFPAGAVTDAAGTIIQPLAESRGITFADRAEGEGRVHFVGDEDRVRQILVNLLTNAVKFTGAGGTVTLERGASEQADADARLRGPGPWTYFRVRDTGKGIPPEELSRIFEPFVQVETGHTRSRDGSGLGLTISRRLARLMRGDITVRSEVGKGSAFTLWLPAAGESRPAEGEQPGAAEERKRLRGLADIGEMLLRELEPMVETFVTRIREECPTPGASTLRFYQLADHAPSYLADLAGMLIALDESEGQASSILSDAADIHRLLAGRHGAQRARLGWNEAAIRCEYDILRGEIERCIRQRARSVDTETVEEAIEVTRRFLEEAEQTSLRALARVRGGTDSAGAAAHAAERE